MTGNRHQARRMGASYLMDGHERLTSSAWAGQDDFYQRAVEALTPRDRRPGVMGPLPKPKITLRKFSWEA